MNKFSISAGKGWAETFRITDDNANDAPAEMEHGVQIELEDGSGKPVAIASDKNGKLAVVDAGDVHVAFSRKELSSLAPGQYSIVGTVGMPNGEPATVDLGTLNIREAV